MPSGLNSPNMRSIGVLTEFQGIGFLIMLKGLKVLNGRSCKPSLRPIDQQKNKKWKPTCAWTATSAMHPFKKVRAGGSLHSAAQLALHLRPHLLRILAMHFDKHLNKMPHDLQQTTCPRTDVHPHLHRGHLLSIVLAVCSGPIGMGLFQCPVFRGRSSH